MKNPATISLGAFWCLMFDLSLSLGAMGHVHFSRGGELTRCRGQWSLRGEISIGRRCKHYSLSLGVGYSEEPLRNKHHSLGKNGELFLERWCLCLSALVLIVWVTICASARGVKSASSVYAGGNMPDWKMENSQGNQHFFSVSRLHQGEFFVKVSQCYFKASKSVQR